MKSLSILMIPSKKIAYAAVESKAQFFMSWEDTTTTNISPDFYEAYILSELSHWRDILHRSGKRYIQHACGHLKDLLPLLGESRIDALESISPPFAYFMEKEHKMSKNPALFDFILALSKQ